MAPNIVLKILFVEDLPSDVDLAVLELRKEKLQFVHTTVCTGKDLISALSEFKPDLIISDYMMPSFTGLQALKITKEFNSDIPFILYTGSVNEETAVECIKAGAQDYVIKEHLTRLPFAAKEALEQVRIQKEKRASELLLRENEEKLQSIFSAAPVGIGLVVNRVIIEINDAFCNMTGYSRGELIGKSAEVIYESNEEFIRVGDVKYKQIAEKGTGSVEAKIKCKNGTILDTILSSTPLDRNDLSRGVSFTVMNITERKKSEQALRLSEEKYRRIFNNVQDVYFETTKEGEIIEVSPSIETLSRGILSPDDFFGHSVYEFFGSAADCSHVMDELLDKSFVTDFEVTILNKDRSQIPCSVSARLLFDKDGKPEKVIGSLRDITDRKNVSDALKLAKEKAETSDRLKTEFLNNISHEVRTPLNGILGFAEIISLHDLSESEKKDSLAMLFESSNRLLNTITNYMDISLISSGSLSVNKKDFSPTNILRRMYSDFEAACANRNLELLLELPEQSDNFLLNSDPEICKKVITHFLDNAIKFTESGTIKFGFKHNDHELEFFVKDTGIGIGSDSFASIFDKFVKDGNNLYKSSEGSGLGLSIARGMSDAIGARINLESKPGYGSSFYLLIPIKSKIEASQEKNPEYVTALTSGNPILVAEDDETNFYYLNALLNRETKTKILHALNGQEAIDMFKANRDIRLILMDMKMPEIDGFEATKQIKLIDKDVHIIAITAYAMSGDEERILAAGCDGYLSKPINKKNLLEKIAEYTKI